MIERNAFHKKEDLRVHFSVHENNTETMESFRANINLQPRSIKLPFVSVCDLYCSRASSFIYVSGQET